ncbi:ABC transporter permease [Nocardioides marmoriginsengisoli]|uniref:Cell division protein FtsX n=1 Tax=Nocardioides marmoriginsengisoli TaxID=661483 RepID=A0A3N0CI35_9ACTN|nr:permease-like cell division protein FtsX [Nocardioides marmoriginsengisoli]RNL63094.1 ABC transporter permease [Nocardioides marmoriginsengisoli]
MQLKYVFTETRIGLQRNVSMTIAVVVTIFISLTLVGMGLLLNAQADKTEKYWGSRLQITVYLCNDANIKKEHCTSGEADQAQKSAIEDVLKSHPEVDTYDFRTKDEAFAIFKRVYITDDKDSTISSVVTADDMQESYRVTLKNPRNYLEVESALKGMDGVEAVEDLRTVLQPIYNAITWMKWGAISIAAFLLMAAILQVGNTIRLAAFARRKEIGIMRLVGASTLYISLPFLLETLAAAAIAIVLSGATIGAVMQFVIRDRLRHNFQVTDWIGWADLGQALGAISVLGVVITLIPTLVMTRKYLKV